MFYVIGILIVVFLLYALVGIWSIIPYILGFLYGILRFLIDLISWNIYPVSGLVYFVSASIVLYAIFQYFIRPFIHLKK